MSRALNLLKYSSGPAPQLSLSLQPIRSNALHTSSQHHGEGGDGSSKVAEGPQAKFFPAMKTPMLPADSFKNRTVFITGGGTGLGRGMATMLSSLGADVVIGARRLSVLQDTARSITAATGREVLAVEMDVRKPEAVAAALDACQSKFGLPHVVINNAAGNFISPSERLSPNAWRTIIDIVLNGTANVTLEAGRRLIKAKQGCSFLSITTPYTRSGSGFVCPSSSAKAGVEAMSKSLCSEWGRYGMRFNCLAPGPVETDGAFSRLDPSGQFRNSAHKRIPAGRMGEVEEVANLAAYLVSDYSSWISGETIALDGGGYWFGAGTMNDLTSVSSDQWNVLERIIRENRAPAGISSDGGASRGGASDTGGRSEKSLSSTGLGASDSGGHSRDSVILSDGLGDGSKIRDSIASANGHIGGEVRDSSGMGIMRSNGDGGRLRAKL